MPREADIIFSWFSSVPDNVKALFTRPTEFRQIPTPPPAPKGDNRSKYTIQLQQLGWPHPLPGILNKYAGDIKPLRVAFMGFSEGCQGVSGMLRSADAAFIDTAIGIDGYHSPFLGPPNKDRSNIAVSSIAPLIEFSKIASGSPYVREGVPLGRRTSIITHSSIVPTTYASTTETANIVLKSLFGENWPTQSVPSAIVSAIYNPPIQLHGNVYNNHKTTIYSNTPTKYAIHDSGLYVLGFNDLDPTGINDHIYQAEIVLPQVLQYIVAPNWNAVDPKTGVCVSGSPLYQSVSYAINPGGSCSMDPPTLVPGDITDPNAKLPDGSLDYNKWIPKNEQDILKKKQKDMTWWEKLIFLFTGVGMVYAGIKATDAIVNSEGENKSELE